MEEGEGLVSRLRQDTFLLARLHFHVGANQIETNVASPSQAFSGEEKACLRATCSSGMCWSRYHEPQYHNIG